MNPERVQQKLLLLRLHVRRVVEYDAPKNSAGIKTVYDIAGTTDESGAFPYDVVCSELPPGIPRGTNVYAEATFVGYFLKVLGYDDKLGKHRGTPVLIGRIRKSTGGTRVAAAQTPSAGLGLMLAMGAVGLGAAALFGTMFWRLSRTTRRLTPVPTHTARPSAEVEGWLENFPATELAPNPPENPGGVPGK